jgi:uncharacterized protein YkwD
MFKPQIFKIVLACFAACFVISLPFAEARGSSGSEAQVLRLINSARARGVSCRGGGGGMSLAPLRYNPTLRRAAKTHALNMANYGFMSHYFRGIGPRTRIIRAGYRYSRMSEIIYKYSGRSSAASAVRWWLHSPVHCRAIMNRYYREFGAAYGGSGAWAVEMAQPR